jgi:two-component system response regulator NreC
VAQTPDSTGSRAARRSSPGAGRETPPPRDESSAGIRVLCVDDHAVLVEGLKAQFAIDGRIRVVGRLASADALLEEAARLKPDVVVLDIEMPGPDVFEMADRLHHQHPQMRFVFLSAHIRDGYLAAAYKCGAWGYFSKADDLEDISAGLLEVARSQTGTFVMGPKVRQRLQAAAGTPARRAGPSGAGGDEVRGEGPPAVPIASLTGREIEVLRLIGKGMARNEIAAELSRSAKTIDGHQERMMKKLGLHSRAELMRFAIREGLAEA